MKKRYTTNVTNNFVLGGKTMKKDSNLTIATILWIAVEVTLLAKLIMEQNQVFFGILVRVAVIVGIYGFFLERKL